MALAQALTVFMSALKTFLFALSALGVSFLVGDDALHKFTFILRYITYLRRFVCYCFVSLKFILAVQATYGCLTLY